MRLLVTGASGLLGLNLSLVASAHGYEVVGWVHSQHLQGVPFETLAVDFRKTELTLKIFSETRPDAVVHCAALADLNKAEVDPALANQLNAKIPAMLAEKARHAGIPFLHISTDAVFDGKDGAYTEDSGTNPLSVYAQSKRAGELAVMDANPEALIARVVFYGWSLTGKRSLSEFFFNHLQAGKRVKGFSDTYFCPLYVEDLAEILLDMMKNRLYGLFHVVSPESLSKYDFGLRIARQFGFDPTLIEPVSMGEIHRQAPRALHLILRPDKAQGALGYELPSIDAGIKRLHQRYLDDYHRKLQAFAGS